jgi:electron transfer flavoprotein beta subunit
VIPVEALNFSDDALTPRTYVEEIFFPPETEGAEIIEGDPATVAENITRIMKEKGVNI